MSLLFIDDQGEIWSGHSQQLRVSFDTPYSGGDFAEYAVGSLGFVAINLYGGSCQVRLQPGKLRQPAINGLRNWLAHTPNERVVLTWLDASWRSELWRSAKSLMERIEALVAAAARQQSTDYLARPLTLDEVHERSPLGQILRDWRRLGVPTGQRELLSLLEQVLGNRYVVVRRDDETGRLVYQEVGDGLFSMCETWRNCAVGAPMEEMPDRVYGRWATKSYAETLDNGLPRIEDVDAIVRWPHSRFRMRYKRIIVPIREAASAPVLLGGSIRDDRIDLRFVRS